MKFLPSAAWIALLVAMFSPAVFAAAGPEATSVYFSPYPAVPEQVRTDRDVVRWRLAGELFDEGPGLEGVPFPVLVGTTQQIAAVNRMLATSVQTFGPVRGYEQILPQFCAPSPEPGLGAINVTNGYHDEEAVAALLTDFATNFPDLAQKFQIGASTLGRPIWALKISDNVAVDEPEPRVVIDAGIHPGDGVDLNRNSAFHWGGDNAGSTSYAANGYGVCDAAGNAAEWCWDWSGPYAVRAAVNPTGPASGTVRVVRGGSWSNAPAGLRCAARASLAPAASNAVVGLRCVRR